MKHKILMLLSGLSLLSFDVIAFPIEGESQEAKMANSDTAGENSAKIAEQLADHQSSSKGTAVSDVQDGRAAVPDTTRVTNDQINEIAGSTASALASDSSMLKNLSKIQQQLKDNVLKSIAVILKFTQDQIDYLKKQFNLSPDLKIDSSQNSVTFLATITLWVKQFIQWCLKMVQGGNKAGASQASGLDMAGESSNTQVSSLDLSKQVTSSMAPIVDKEPIIYDPTKQYKLSPDVVLPPQLNKLQLPAEKTSTALVVYKGGNSEALAEPQVENTVKPNSEIINENVQVEAPVAKEAVIGSTIEKAAVPLEVKQVKPTNQTVQNVFTNLSEADRNNLVKLKILMNSMNIKSSDSPQYVSILAKFFPEGLPKDITFDVLINAKKEDISSVSSSSEGSLAEMLSKKLLGKKAIIVSSPQDNLNNGLTDDSKPSFTAKPEIIMTEKQKTASIIQDSIEKVIADTDPSDPIFALKVKGNSQSLAEKGLTAYYTDEATKQFNLDKPSLIEAYKKDNAIVLEALRQEDGNDAVTDRINTAMYKERIDRIKKIIAEKQKDIDAAGADAKIQAEQKLAKSKSDNSIKLKAVSQSDNAAISQERQKGKMQKINELKGPALENFNNDKVLINKITLKFQDAYLKEKGKLPEPSEIKTALDDYFNLTVFSKIKKDNDAVIGSVEFLKK